MSKTMIDKAQTYFDSMTDAADVEPVILMAGFALEQTAELRAEVERLKEREKRIAQAADWVLEAEHTSSVGFKILNRVIADIEEALADSTDGGEG